MHKTTDVMKEDVVDLRTVLKVMAKRKLIIILGTFMAVAMGAILVFYILQPVYEAKVLLRVNNTSLSTDPRALDNGREGVVNTLSHLPHMSIETHVGQLKSEALLQRVTERLQLEDANNIYDTVNVTIVNDSNLILLKFRYNDPLLTMDVANTISEQYIDFISEASKREIERSIKLLEELQSLTRSELIAMLTQLNEIRVNQDAPQSESQAQIEYLEAEIFHLRKTMDLLAERILEARIAGSINFGQASVVIVSRATIPKNPVKPNKPLYLVVAFILGLFFSLPFVFVKEQLDNRIWTAEAVEEHMSLPVLCELPLTADKDLLLTNHNSGSILAEAYRMLRTNLSYATPGNSCRTLLVTSPGPSDGKSTVAANLATVLVKAGFKVLLVDCDLRKPSLHSFFGLDNSRGLVDVLLKKGSAMEYAFPIDGGLHVLTSGLVPKNPAEIILRNETRHFWSQQLKFFDYIVIDSPPVMAVTDAVLLSTQVDGVILTLSAGTTRVHIARKIKERLTKVNACIVGVVLNQVKTRKKDVYLYR